MVSAKICGARPGKAHALLKSHGDHDRQVALLPCSGDGGSGLGQVKLRFNKDEVCPASHKTANLRGKGGDKVARLHRPQRLGKMAGWPHIARHKDRPPRLRRGLPGNLDHTAVKRKNIQTLGQLVYVAAKGARGQQVDARVQIGLMDTSQGVGVFHAEFFGGGASGHARCLKHGSHGAVEQKRPAKAEGLSECHHRLAVFPAHLPQAKEHLCLPPALPVWWGFSCLQPLAAQIFADQHAQAETGAACCRGQIIQPRRGPRQAFYY